MAPKVKATKAKINKSDYIKLKSFCKAKEMIYQQNRKGNILNWRKYLQTIFVIKGYYTKYITNTYNTIFKNLINKMGRGFK